LASHLTCELDGLSLIYAPLASTFFNFRYILPLEQEKRAGGRFGEREGATWRAYRAHRRLSALLAAMRSAAYSATMRSAAYSADTKEKGVLESGKGRLASISVTATGW